MKYYVVFSLGTKPVAGTWVEADSDGNALLAAEFKIMCMLPNVKYDALDITEKKDVVPW